VRVSNKIPIRTMIDVYKHGDKSPSVKTLLKTKGLKSSSRIGNYESIVMNDRPKKQ